MTTINPVEPTANQGIAFKKSKNIKLKTKKQHHTNGVVFFVAKRKLPAKRLVSKGFSLNRRTPYDIMWSGLATASIKQIGESIWKLTQIVCYTQRGIASITVFASKYRRHAIYGKIKGDKGQNKEIMRVWKVV